jgi:hypothetical protein
LRESTISKPSSKQEKSAIGFGKNIRYFFLGNFSAYFLKRSKPKCETYPGIF